MKKFEFKLEKLLSYKEQVLDGEMLTLATLNGRMSDLQKRRYLLEKEAEDSKDAFEKKLAEQVTPSACALYNNYREHLREEIRRTDRELEAVAGQIDAQRDVIKELKMETKSLETLKSSRFDEYSREQNKKAEWQIEEFVSAASILRKTV